MKLAMDLSGRAFRVSKKASSVLPGHSGKELALTLNSGNGKPATETDTKYGDHSGERCV
jgi:hypothetical protein